MKNRHGVKVLQSEVQEGRGKTDTKKPPSARERREEIVDAVRQSINTPLSPVCKRQGRKSPNGKSPIYKRSTWRRQFFHVAHTFVFTVKEPREHLSVELFIMENPSKPKY